MVKVKFDGKQWNVVSEEVEGEDILYLDGKLKEKLDNIKKIIKKGWDCCIVIDGKERSGKSILGITCLWYLLDCNLGINNIATEARDAANKIKILPDKSGLLIDESSLVFNSKDAMKQEAVWLTKIMDVVGQKNMVFVLCMPSFFDLNKQLAIRRSRFLLHVYTDEELNRGRFAYFGEHTKHVLFEMGKKNWGSYDKPAADFVGRFADWHAPFYDEYLRLKKLSLAAALEEPAKPKEKKWMRQRNLLIKEILNNRWMIQEDIAKLLGIAQAHTSELFNQEEKCA